MTKQDKRVCGVCLEHGHTSVDCPRRHGDMVMVSEALPDELRRLQAASAERERARMAYTARHEPSAMVYTGPYEEIPAPTLTLPPQVPSPSSCPRCGELEAEVVKLKTLLKDRNANAVTHSVTGMEHVTGIVTRNKRGRPRSGNALTPAQKQRAYRERRA